MRKMAVNVKKLQDRIGTEADIKDIHAWINEAAMRGLTSQDLEDYVMDKFYLSTLNDDKRSESQELFDKKWGDSDQKRDIDIVGVGDEEVDEDDDDMIEDEDDMMEEVETDIIETPSAKKPENDDVLPFDNPNLENLNDEDQVRFIEAEKAVSRPKPDILRKMRRYDEEYVTRRVPSTEFDQEMVQFRPYIDYLKNEPGILEVLARTQTPSNHLPYDYAKSFLINNPLMDPNNRSVLMDVVDEERPDSTVKKHIPLPQCHEIAKNLAEQGFFQASLNDFSDICTEYEEYVRHLIYLIHNLQIQLESKQKAPFEFSIPKQVLSQTIMESFEGIKALITEQVINEMKNMRNDLSGEMVDVGGIVEKNLKGLESQIAGAIDKVVWKVKTDVEETNLEDIKKSVLFILNKRASAYQLGTGPLGVLTLMLDDLQRRIVNQNFKSELVKEQRRYTITEIQRKLGHKRNTVVIKAIPKLSRLKLIKMYGNKTFSL